MRGLIHGLLAAGVLLGIPGTVLAAEGAPAVDSGDTAWVLISAALVMLMTPGLAFFYGGMVRSKNVLTTIMQSFFIVAMVSVHIPMLIVFSAVSSTVSSTGSLGCSS